MHTLSTWQLFLKCITLNLFCLGHSIVLSLLNIVEKLSKLVVGDFSCQETDNLDKFQADKINANSKTSESSDNGGDLDSFSTLTVDISLLARNCLVNFCSNCREARDEFQVIAVEGSLFRIYVDSHAELAILLPEEI